MEIVVFGNPSLSIDNLAIKVGKELQKTGIKVLHRENPIELADLSLDECVILDVAEGIDEPRIIENVDRLVLGRLCSLHDFDMAYMLKLLKELGTLGTLRIIALPQHGEAEALLPKVEELLRKV